MSGGDADLTGALLTGATLRGSARGAIFKRTDLRSADLSALWVVVPRYHIDSTGHSSVVYDHPEAVIAAAELFAEATYNDATAWPPDITPEQVPGRQHR